jgi:hypothetical protein
MRAAYRARRGEGDGRRERGQRDQHDIGGEARVDGPQVARCRHLNDREPRSGPPQDRRRPAARRVGARIAEGQRDRRGQDDAEEGFHTGPCWSAGGAAASARRTVPPLIPAN